MVIPSLYVETIERKLQTRTHCKTIVCSLMIHWIHRVPRPLHKSLDWSQWCYSTQRTREFSQTTLSVSSRWSPSDDEGHWQWLDKLKKKKKKKKIESMRQYFNSCFCFIEHWSLTNYTYIKKSLTLDACRDWIILVQHSKYHGCWCPGSLRHQDISTHDINYVEYHR